MSFIKSLLITILLAFALIGAMRVSQMFFVPQAAAPHLDIDGFAGDFTLHGPFPYDPQYTQFDSVMVRFYFACDCPQQNQSIREMWLRFAYSDPTERAFVADIVHDTIYPVQ